MRRTLITVTAVSLFVIAGIAILSLVLRWAFGIDYKAETHWVDLGDELKITEQRVYTVHEITPNEVTIRSESAGEHPPDPQMDWSLRFTRIDSETKRVNAQFSVGSYYEGYKTKSQWLAEGDSIKAESGVVYTIRKVHDSGVTFAMHYDHVISEGSEASIGDLLLLEVADIRAEDKRVKFICHVPKRVGPIRGFLSM